MDFEQKWIFLIQSNYPTSLHPDDVLCNRKYYFHVRKDENGKTIDCAVVPSFDNWIFPSQIPAAWNLPFDVDCIRSEKCLISGRSMTEKAHCIPAVNEAWFLRNKMGNYAKSATSATISTSIAPSTVGSTTVYGLSFPVTVNSP